MSKPSHDGKALAQARVQDALITADRAEQKHLVPLERVTALATALNHRLPNHRFQGPGANGLPRPHHFVTTIYFDTLSRAQYREARADSRNSKKLRAKEYYDLHPSLAEVATNARQIVKYKPLVWLELKTRTGERTGKQRLGVAKSQLPELFGGRVAVPAADQAAWQEIADYTHRLGEPVRADCLVNYRRLAWQDPAGSLRITLDLGLAFYEPPSDLWERSFALTRDTLGRPCAQLDGAVLELKYRDLLPWWLLELLVDAAAQPSSLSKFELASQAVHDG